MSSNAENRPSTMMIDDTLYVRSDQSSRENTARQIVVTEGRWNFVGDVVETKDEDGKFDGIVMTNAAVIIYWGTTTGLGQLALTGKTDKTRLGELGTVHIPKHSIVARINVTSDF
jgi:hypothetical protein